MTKVERLILEGQVVILERLSYLPGNRGEFVNKYIEKVNKFFREDNASEGYLR